MSFNISDVQQKAWDVRFVVNFLRSVPIGSVKSTFDLADDFISSFGVDNNDSGFWDVLHNMCAAFDWLHNIGDVKVSKNDEGVPFLTFIRDSGLSPN